MTPPPQPLRALIVENSEADALLLIEALKRGGYEPDWQRVETEPALRAALAAREWDVVFCDYAMPQFDAPGVLRVLRENGDILTAIIVSGKVGEDVAVEAMRMGANDFILKDNLGRVVPAMERELRASQTRRERHAAALALRQSEERYRVLFDKSPWPMWVYDPETLRYLAANEMAVKDYGYSHEEFLGMTLKDLRPLKDVPGLVEHLDGMDGHSDTQRKRLWRHRKKDGSMIVVEIANQPIICNGQIARVVQAVDVTERCLADEQIQEQAALLDEARDAICVNDLNQRILYWNKSAERLYGWTSDEALGRNANELLCQGSVALTAIKKLIQRGEWRGDLKQTTRQGGQLVVDCRWTLIRDTAGAPKSILIISTDITEAKKAEERIREQAALLDHAQDAILALDLEGRVKYWNKSAERLFGWSADEALGSKVQDLLCESPESYEVPLKATLSLGSWSGEATKRTKAGDDVLIEARWTLLRDEAGKPKAILVIDTDITERKKIEAQFLRAQRMESIGTLAGGIAHDLNNVLGPIIMAVDILRLRLTAPKDRDLLDLMETSGRRGAEMVKQVLYFARGIEGRRVLMSPVLLVKELQRIACDTFPKSITVEADTPAETWNIPGDRTQLHQVLLNLCVNARDAMPRGGRLQLSVRNRQIDAQFAAMCPEAHPGPYVVLKVTDTGQGMPPKVLERIFEPFFTTKEIGKGTGLGLSTTQAIVKSHGGFIVVESKLGKGTTFLVNLPAETGCAEVQAETVAQELPRGNGEIILIIDDEAAIRSITGQTLEAFGYRVMSAGDGAEGVAKYAQHAGEIAAVLTDMMMPVMDGAATIRVLMRLNPGVKIIAASGASDSGVEAEAAGAGVKHFLPKPYTAESLLRTLSKLLHPEA